MDDQEYVLYANDVLGKVRSLLWQASKICPDVPYAVIVALIAESALLTNDPDAWTAELIAATGECRQLKMDSLMQERQGVSLH